LARGSRGGSLGIASQRTRLLAQVAVETYSVLTRLPPPQRVSPSLALGFLQATFAFPPVALSPDGFQQLLDLAATRTISGGAVYDALIGATAKQESATLLTLDQRAVATYQLLGVDFRFVG